MNDETPTSPDEKPRRTAIVAEDESLIRMDIVETLTEAGYEVIAAVGDGESAITKTRELRPDVVVMDVKMPQVDGVTARAGPRPPRPTCGSSWSSRRPW